MFSLKSKETKPFLLPVLTLVLVFLISFFFLKPKIATIFKARRELLSNKKILANLTKKLALLEGLAKAELSERVDLVLKVLPAEKKVPQNLFVLKKLVLETGLDLDSIAFGEVGEIATISGQAKIARGEILPSLPLKVAVSGERGKIKDFVDQLESTAPLVRIDKITISEKRTEELPEALLEIETFFLPLPRTIGKVDRPILPISQQEEKVFERLADFKFFKTEEDFSSLPTGKENPFQ